MLRYSALQAMEESMTGAFDNHSKVVVLEFLVQRLIVRDCLTTQNPKRQLTYWLGQMNEQRELTQQFAFDKNTPPDASVYAPQTMSDYEDFGNETFAT
jgi:hypothetical protein